MCFTSDLYVEDETMKEIMKRTVEGVKAMRTELTPREKKELHCAINFFEKDEFKEDNIINDYTIYCEACLISHLLSITKHHRFVQILSGRVWDVFQTSVSKTLAVEPVPLVCAEKLITGM